MVAHPGAVVAHPGAVVAHPGAVVAHPGAVVAHPGAMEAHLEPWRLRNNFGGLPMSYRDFLVLLAHL
jgi:hypothetical protein